MVETISFFREPRTTMGGVNLVAGFRPELCYTRPVTGAYYFVPAADRLRRFAEVDLGTAR